MIGSTCTSTLSKPLTTKLTLKKSYLASGTKDTGYLCMISSISAGNKSKPSKIRIVQRVLSTMLLKEYSSLMITTRLEILSTSSKIPMMRCLNIFMEKYFYTKNSTIILKPIDTSIRLNNTSILRVS